MKLLLVDDHPLFAVGFAHALTQADPALHVLTAPALDDAMAIAAAEPELDIVLVDYRLGACSGIDGLRQMGARFPLLARMLISGEETHALVASARAAGASGFIGKSMPLEAMLAALHTVAGGGVAFALAAEWPRLPPGLAGAASASTSTSTFTSTAAPTLAAAPTQRQREVLSLVASGQPNKRIASELGIAERTVKLHVTALLDTLGARNRTHLVAVARQAGLL